MEDVGKRIKNRRKKLGLSAEQVAALIGVSPATVYRYESNHIINMGTDKLKSIAKALQTTPEILMGWQIEEDVQKENSIIVDAVVRMRTDEKFLSIVEMLHSLQPEQLEDVRQLLNVFLKQFKNQV